MISFISARIRQLLILTSLFWVLPACEKFGVDGLRDGSVVFEGIKTVEFTQKGSYIFTWKPALNNQKLNYSIYMQDMGPQEEAPEASGQPLGLRGGNREALLGVANEEILPKEKGELVTTLEQSENSYELKLGLKPDHVYAFSVKAWIVDGEEDGNETVAFLTASTNEGYQGCLSAVSTGPSVIKIEVEFPIGAKRVNIFRDSIRVGIIDSPVDTIFTDSGLEIGKTYTYRCEAEVGNERLVGLESPSLGTENPLSGYEGCIDAVVSGQTATLQFAFPPEAEQVLIYRDGLQIYGSTSPAGTSYVDQAVVPGKTYEYQCEAHIDGVKGIGFRKLKVRIPDTLGTFTGCIEGKALGAAEIQLDFQVPTGVDELKIYRNGIPIYSTKDTTELSYIDSNLSEGLSYRYLCSAIIGDYEKIGTVEIEVTTISTNPPVFGGITDVEVNSADNVVLRWGVTSSSGVSADRFEIYASVGTLVEWGAPPIITETAASISTILKNLGDELPYAFGVRACSAQDICDTNTVMIRKTLPDNGMPKTVGATAAEIIDGKISVTAPWKPSQGAVLKRLVYIRKGELSGLNLDDYVLSKTDVTTDIGAPNETILIGGIEENSKYHVIVIDEDPVGNKTLPEVYVTVETGDLTPPAFSGIGGLKTGTVGIENTTLTTEFTATDIESAGTPAGAMWYLFYLIEGSAANACKEGTIYKEVLANTFVPGDISSYVLEGLKEKVQYSVCVKARDAAGNISNSTTYLKKYTLDLTKPNYDGIQSIVYIPETSLVDVGWNKSPSPDTVSYKVQLWRNTTNPAQNEISTFIVEASKNESGFSVSQSEFAFIGNDMIYGIVDACDNAHMIPDGSQNCTASDTPFAYLVPDVTPPQGFLGVEGSVLLQTPAEGAVDVFWKAPTGGDWNDYSGFKIYNVTQDEDITDDSLVFLKDCPCSGVNCPNTITSCSITGLDPYRTFYFHVRAYDEVGNITTYLNPAVYTTAKRTSDTTVPVFTSNLTAEYDQGTVQVDWAAATDGQYSLEPSAVITYKIYRKKGTTYSAPNDPTLDAESILLGNQEEISYIDDALESNVTYFYTICATDASANSRCDGTIREITTPDVVIPVIEEITSTKLTDEELKEWTVSWIMTDNSDPATLRVGLRSVFSDSEIPPETDAEYTNVITEQDGIFQQDLLTGPTNENKYVHYLLSVRDLAGNTAKAKLTLYSQNRIDLSAVKRNSGTSAGGNLIVVEGDGFADGATVLIGAMACINVTFYTKTKIGCTTPSQVPGQYTITVTNPAATGFASLPSAFEYLNPGDAGLHFCDQVVNQMTNGFPQGDGSAIDPYVICTGPQLDYVRTTNYNRYFELWNNIDLSSYTNNSFAPIKFANSSWAYGMNFDGMGFTIANYTYKEPLESNVGLFNRLNSDFLIKDLNLVNFDLEGLRLVGLLTGHTDRYSCISAMENIFVQGKILAHEDTIGGIAGGASRVNGQNLAAEVDITVDYTGAGGKSYVGGAFGYLHGNCQLTNLSAKGDIYVEKNERVGGLIGSLSTGTVNGCDYTGTITKPTGWSRIGGGFGFVVGNTTDRGVVANCTIKATINAGPLVDRVGGIIGEMYDGSELTNSSFSGSLSGRHYLGGLAGFLRSNNLTKMSNNTADVIAVGAGSYVGGALGFIQSWSTASGDFVIENNSVSGSVSGIERIGGFLGSNQDCHSGNCNDTAIFQKNTTSADVEGSVTYIGGFVGIWESIPDSVVLSQNSATGKVVGNTCVGGFAGFIGGTVEDSYSSGEVTAGDRGSAFSGCVGSYNERYTPTIRRSYSSSVVVRGLGIRFGGITSTEYSWGTPLYPKEYAGLFWNVETSQIDDTEGDVSQIFGLTTAQMKNQATFNGAGWNFAPVVGIWKMSIKTGYPILMWETD